MKSTFFKKNFVFFWLFVLLFVFLTIQPVQAYTLEDIMSYAFPSSLIAAPRGSTVAWVFNWEGKRNIWIAQGPEFKARQLTQYSEDDGQELGELAFNFEGTIIIYVRGGSANRAGEIPNPTSNPEGAEQALWAVRLEGGEPWELAKGNSPVPSPTEDKLVFSARGQIYLLSLAESSRPEVLFKARGRNGSPCWSPDGKKIAFVSSRDDHSFIGVYDLENKTIGWLAPSVDRDGYPVWSPCGKYIAFIRFPGSMATPTYRDGQRFALMAADVESGQAEEIWRCPNETGGFSQYYPDQTLRWAADGYLVFYSEHEKWMHLYSISVKDRKVVCLTPGEYEVENSFLAFDGKTLIYNSNSGDIDRRHIWSVPVPGGKSKPLTSGDGIEWSPVLLPNGDDLPSSVLLHHSLPRQL